LEDRIEFGEVQYFFRLPVSSKVIHTDLNAEARTVAAVKLFARPNREILEHSYGVVWAARFQDVTGLAVVDVRAIRSVVAMVPFPRFNMPEGGVNIPVGVALGEQPIFEQPQYVPGWIYFLIEKLGLDITYLGEGEEDDGET
jgi:hypothetical protein